MALQVVNKFAESRMVQILGDLHGEAPGWQLIHFHLSDLLEEYKSEYQVKIAINLIHDLLKNHEGYLFVLIDNSIAVLCHKLEKLLQDKLIFQLRYLYMDDPLCYDDQGQENPNFCTVYDVRYDWHNLEALCAHYMAYVARKQGSEGTTVELKPLPKPVPRKRDQADRMPKLTLEKLAEKTESVADIKVNDEMDSIKLGAIEQLMRTIDMRAVTRRQPVCAVLPDMTIRRVFDELYIHIAHLRKLLKVDPEFFTNRWLFKYITQLLDQRMIDLITANPDNYLSGPVSINLNIETMLSPWFAEFDSHIKPATKVSMVIEVPVVDLFADMPALPLHLPKFAAQLQPTNASDWSASSSTHRTRWPIYFIWMNIFRRSRIIYRMRRICFISGAAPRSHSPWKVPSR